MAFFNPKNSKAFLAPIFLLGFFISGLQLTGAQSVGVCNGRNGDNLPSDGEVIDLYKSNGIGRMHLQSLTDAAAATNWVQNNIKNYSPDVKFKYIAVGNEVHPGDAEAQYVQPAMQSILNAITAAGLQDQIKVSTSIDTTLLGNSFPPSAGSFSDSASSYITPIINFLAANGAPLLINVYPYFSYTDNPSQISLPYALFTSPGVVVNDGNLGYQNLFDAIVDAHYSALEKAGAPNLPIVVSESGWPSEGGDAASTDNAGTYYNNLINHVKGRGEIEKHFGLFLPNKQPKYQISSFG
ncbi:hypothetical protein SLA2020_388690 [Shorea laevis]